MFKIKDIFKKSTKTKLVTAVILLGAFYDPIERYMRVEAPLDGVLRGLKIGYVDGGSTMFGQSEVLVILKNNSKRVKNTLIEVLQEISRRGNLPPQARLVIEDDEPFLIAQPS